MTPATFNRLHDLRHENDAAGYAMQELRPRFAAMDTRHKDGTAPHAVVAYQLFQTPVEVAASLVALLGLVPGCRILEPSAGLGRLLDAIAVIHQPGEVVAVEIAPQCAAELYAQNREGVVIKQRDFLELRPEDLGLFDAVVMNPPFHMRADIRHIERALTFLRPGGKLAGICMDTETRRVRIKPRTSTWIELPDAFRESGTGVAAAMFTITNK